MGIKIFTTGGTIDKTYFDAKSEYEVGDPQIYDILREARVQAGYEIETILRKDSLDLTAEDRRVSGSPTSSAPPAALITLCRSSGCDSSQVVITHGTDTMVDTAHALESVSGKTIVLVGSLAPARFKFSDAEFNIGFALAAVQTLPHGVYIAMNGRIFEPGRVRKNREANRFEPV